MNGQLHREPDSSRCRPDPTALEERLGRLEGFLHHLMSDLAEALELLEGVRGAAGVDQAEHSPDELRPPTGPES